MDDTQSEGGETPSDPGHPVQEVHPPNIDSAHLTQTYDFIRGQKEDDTDICPDSGD